MGLLLDFYAGDARRIGEALSDPEGAVDLGTAPFVRGHADFSMHLSLEELDALVAAACERRGLPPRALTSSLVQHLAGSEDPSAAEFGADVVSPELVELFAGLGPEDAGPVAGSWCASIDAEPNEEAEAALRDLVRLCQVAKAEQAAVVFAWSL